MITLFPERSPEEEVLHDLRTHPPTVYSLRRAYEVYKRLLASLGLPLDWGVRGRHGIPSAYPEANPPKNPNELH